MNYACVMLATGCEVSAHKRRRQRLLVFWEANPEWEFRQWILQNHIMSTACCHGGQCISEAAEPPCSSMRPTWDSISLVKKKIWICPAPITYYHKSIQFHLPPHLYPHVWHNYQIPHVHTPCAIDPGRALSYPLSIHQSGPSPSPSRPFISIGMREVK